MRRTRLLTHLSRLSLMLFLYQAEDGIRYWSVTGVQTCALPIWLSQTQCGLKDTIVRRLLWILLAILTIVLMVLVLQQNEAALEELSRFDTSSLETKVMALALVGLIALTLFRQRFSHALESVLIWVMVAALLALGYTYRFELREVSERVLAELIPGRAATRGRTVEIARASGGGFSVAAQVNGAHVPMVLDTGASAVVLTHEAAKAAGLP